MVPGEYKFTVIDFARGGGFHVRVDFEFSDI